MRGRESGFSLFEMMTATTVVMVMAVPTTAMLLKTLSWYNEVNSQLASNRQAREVADILLNGGNATTNGTDSTTNIYGIRARRLAPTGTLRSNYVLQYGSNGHTLTSATFGTQTVGCKAAGNPLPDCSATESKTVQGWLGSDVSLNSTVRSVNAKTTEVLVTMVNPYQAQRAEVPAHAIERYRLIVYRNRDENDP